MMVKSKTNKQKKMCSTFSSEPEKMNELVKFLLNRKNRIKNNSLRYISISCNCTHLTDVSQTESNRTKPKQNYNEPIECEYESSL